jgi:hypothetical protein
MHEVKIDHARLSEVDLMLVALDAIRTAGSVTKAANRLGVNQSSVSHQFGDELFVRSGTGMIRGLAGQRSPGSRPRSCGTSRRACSLELDFSPASTSRIFKLAIPDDLGSVLIPPLARFFRGAAPKARLELHSLVGTYHHPTCARGFFNWQRRYDDSIAIDRNGGDAAKPRIER